MPHRMRDTISQVQGERREATFWSPRLLQKAAEGKTSHQLSRIVHKLCAYLWSLERINKVCLSRITMVTSGRKSFETATSMPHASVQSRRGGDRRGPNHTSSGPLCVELSELTSSIPTGSPDKMGRAAAIALPRPAEEIFSQSLFSSGIGLDGINSCTVLERAISATAVAKESLHSSFQHGYAHAARIRSKPSRSDGHGPNHTSSGALRVELSELTSSIPYRVTGRVAAIARLISTITCCVVALMIYCWSWTILLYNGAGVFGCGSVLWQYSATWLRKRVSSTTEREGVLVAEKTVVRGCC